MDTPLNLITSATFLSIVAAWIIYRIGVWSERSRVLESIEKEIALHSNWVNTQYEDQRIPLGSDWHHLNYVVFKISTVAVDNAIEKGPGLFLNKTLLSHLIVYRQQINQVNQLIDTAMMYQSNIELWSGKPSKMIKDKMQDLTGQIHWYGIGTASRPAAYTYFNLVKKELEREKDSRLLPLIWILLNINLFSLKRFLYKYV